MSKRTIRKALTTVTLSLMIGTAAVPLQAFASVPAKSPDQAVEASNFYEMTAYPMVSNGYEVNNNVLIMNNFPGQSGTAKCSEYKVGSTFYTYNSKGTSRTTGGGLHYVKIGKSYKYVAGAQCIGFARYIQQKLYGVNDGANRGKFRSVGSLSASKMNESNLKSLIQKGGRGAHLRTDGKQHSFIVLKVTDTYFTVVDANGTAGTAKIGKKSFTYKEYAKSGWGKRGIKFLNVKK